MAKRRIVQKWNPTVMTYWYHVETKRGPFWLPSDWVGVGWPTMEQAKRELERLGERHPAMVVYEE